MSAVTQLVRPPAPEPRPTSLGPVALLRALQKNPIERWAEEHFEQPVVTATRAIGHVLVVNDAVPFAGCCWTMPAIIARTCCSCACIRPG
jgi:hypothetical protein